MPEHTHNCLTLPTGECSGASRSCLALLGNAVTPLSLFLFHTLTVFLHYTLTFWFTLSLSILLFCWFLLFVFLFLLGAMRGSSPWSFWGMLSPHSHFFPFTLSLFCFTLSLFIFLFSSLGISFHSHFLFLLLDLHSIFELVPSEVGSH